LEKLKNCKVIARIAVLLYNHSKRKRKEETKMFIFLGICGVAFVGFDIAAVCLL
jgi:hypothetical protein